MPKLFKAALDPLRVPSLVPVQHLEARTVTFRRWLLEDQQDGGARLLSRALETPGDTPMAFAGAGAAEAAAEAALAALEGVDESAMGGKQEVERRKAAKDLVDVAMQPMELCYHALLINEDNAARAVNWLLAHGTKYRAEFEKKEQEAAAANGGATEATAWSCAMCTFENSKDSVVR